MPPSEASPDDHRLAGELATQAGKLLVDLRAELVAAGDLTKDWPSTYLPPRDWKSRLVGSRTLELTWESEPPAGVAMASGGKGSRASASLAVPMAADWVIEPAITPAAVPAS